jgi:two-component system response regulator YesN
MGDRRVMEVLAFISSHYGQPLTRELLARHVNLSPSRLHSLFRNQMNTTPRAAIMAKRMEKAAELLCTTHLLVKEVAARVGIQDVSHFVRDFAKFYGLWPTAYRRTYHSDRTHIVFAPGSIPALNRAALDIGQMANK